MQIEVIEGDITTLKVDAIVNAAKSSLLGGGGVDGAIHRAAGPQLLAACKELNGCATGDAKITPGFQLPAQFVIHTVGPVWLGGTQNEPELLASCYQKSLALATANQLHSIAFPCISTGVYNYPKDQATIIALRSVFAFINTQSTDNPTTLKQIIFCCFSASDAQLYRQQLNSSPN